MNKEYRKFNEPADVYIPPATDPGYFSNLPDVLIPPDYQETDINPLEKDVADLIRETETPPPTPPELEPGKAGCRVFRDVKHYVDPCYQDPAYQRMFTVKLIISNMITTLPTLLTMIFFICWDDLDYVLVSNPPRFYILFGLSALGKLVSIYFVGLCRNWPALHIAVVLRTLMNTILFCMFMLISHLFFLQISAHPVDRGDETNHTDIDDTIELSAEEKVAQEHHLYSDHAPPYMAVLVILLMWLVDGVVCLLVMRRKYPINDYRFPFVIYTTCFSTSALLVTIVLNNSFGHDPVGYDLFQIIAGCYIASLILMRTPEFIERLYEGKVCPLSEGELLYALIHYGL